MPAPGGLPKRKQQKHRDTAAYLYKGLHSIHFRSLAILADLRH